MEENQLFAEKYKPRTLEQLLNQKKAVEKFTSWLKRYIKGETRKIAILSGPSGVGKSILPEIIASQLGLEVVQINPLRISSLDELAETIKNASTMHGLFSPRRGRIIVIDSAENLTEIGSRAVSTVASILGGSKHPIVVITNNAYQPNLRPLRQMGEVITFKRIPWRTIFKFLKEVAEKESLKIPQMTLKEIAVNAKGDVRAALNDLQSLVGAEEVSLYGRQRDTEIDIFTALREVFSAINMKNAHTAIENLPVDYNLFMRWMAENLHLIYTDPKSLAKAFDRLSTADLYARRAAKTGNWSLLRYFFDLLASTGLVSGGKRRGFIPFSFPSYLKKGALHRDKRAEMKNILVKIATKCHVSRRKAYTEYLPLIRIMMQSEQLRKEISRFLELERDEEKRLIGKR